MERVSETGEIGCQVWHFWAWAIWQREIEKEKGLTCSSNVEPFSSAKVLHVLLVTRKGCPALSRQCLHSSSDIFTISSSPFLSVVMSFQDRNAHGCSLLSNGECWERTAPMLMSKASTFSTNWRWGFRRVMMGREINSLSDFSRLGAPFRWSIAHYLKRKVLMCLGFFKVHFAS